jgi:hypothetical protein
MQTTHTIRIRGLDAISYADHLGGSIGLSKHADPVEGERHGLTQDEAREVARVDASLIYLDADTDHPDHAAIMAAIARAKGGAL